MQAYYLNEINGNLEANDLNIQLKEDEFQVKVKMAGLNRRDHWIIRGLYPGITLPAILGSDGLVEHEGKEYLMNPNENWGDNQAFPSDDYTIRGLQIGGTFAEATAVKRNKLFPKPEHLLPEEAAILPLGGLTAYRALISNCRVKPGERVLINGIGGGVALLAFQFAVALGAEVYVSSSQQDKIERAIALGAKGGINYKEENWGKSFKNDNEGFDVIIDSAGGRGFSELINIANRGCRIGIYGGTRGEITSISPQHLFFKQIHIFGSTMGNDQEFAAMMRMVDRLKIRPIVDSVYELKDINLAMSRMLEKDKFGKVAIHVS